MISSFFKKIKGGCLIFSPTRKEVRAYKDKPGYFEVTNQSEGNLYRKIGVNNVKNVRYLVVKGVINFNDLLFARHMINLEILDLSNVVYLKSKSEDYNEVRMSLFKNKEKLRCVWLPKDMKRIPEGFFMDCNKLEFVGLPEGIKYIGANAFMGSGIKNIEIPESVKYIGHMAFDNCEKLETVTLADSAKYIKWSGGQFLGCNNLKYIYIGRNSIFDYALMANCHVDRLVLGKHINVMNIRIAHVKTVECMMKEPPLLLNEFNKDCTVNVYHNYEAFWIAKKWNKMNLVKMD